MMSLIASLGALVPGLFGKNISYKAAKVAGWVVIAVLALLILGTGKCLYDRSVIDKHEAKIEAKASAAREKSAEQQVIDDVKNANSEKELINVVQKAPGGQLSPAAHALACERLRRYGRVPPACRPASGDTSQASSD